VPEEISWERLQRSEREPLSFGDRIQAVEEPGTAFEVTVEKDPGVRLWKGVTLTGGEILDWTSKFWIARVELMDDFDGPVSFRLEPHGLEGCALFLGKDLLTGRRPPSTYVIRDFPRRGHLRLRWLADGR
jgi:hypothetical protein